MNKFSQHNINELLSEPLFADSANLANTGSSNKHITAIAVCASIIFGMLLGVVLNGGSV